MDGAGVVVSTSVPRPTSLGGKASAPGPSSSHDGERAAHYVEGERLGQVPWALARRSARPPDAVGFKGSLLPDDGGEARLRAPWRSSARRQGKAEKSPAMEGVFFCCQGRGR